MKKLVVILCLILSVNVLYARAVREEYRQADEKSQVSYAIGMVIASNFDLAALGLEINYDALSSGVKAVVENSETRFTFQEAIEIIETAMYNAAEKTAQSNYLTEQNFLSANSTQPGVQFTATGLQYIVLVEKEGEKPSPGSTVKVHYTGNFTDGRQFDASGDENGVEIPLEMVIPGWSEGVALMSIGSIYRFFIPSSLAYGREGIQGFIPPYTTLIFTVELLEIMEDAPEQEF